MECSERKFMFEDNNSKESEIITITEVLQPSYGLYVWPSAPVLAQYIWFNRNRIKGRNILELGSGTSLPGILAAKCGGHVTLSDSEDIPHCLENCRKSCQANGLQNIPVIGLTWGKFNNALLDLSPVDIILGSDCFYDSKDFENIIVTVSYLIKKNINAEFWCTYQERSSNRTIDVLLLKWGLECESVSLDSFDADSPSLCGSSLPGNHTIHMFIIRANKR
ncbi:histone-arginine methyltransferase METTL23-like [Saccostrea echinata]|uniref:histone-arginine methyltransferase METTL23-like n=1 Tax=Saccostrea echinata TaxID=191078 RepID=UPI002A7F6F69|nr:histone-arginine methyltransferase METTL23-like [Saccostrea echinata]